MVVNVARIDLGSIRVMVRAGTTGSPVWYLQPSAPHRTRLL